MAAKYFEGRRQVRKPFTISFDKTSRLECAVYEKWEDTEQGVEVACGQADTVGFSITCGVSEKALATLASKIGSSLGVKDVAALSSEISASVGYEINWSVTKTLTHSTECAAPKCGRYALDIRQLVREYELTLVTRKGFIFKSWDRAPTRTIVERTAMHSLWPTVEEFDERCKGCNKPDSPGYDGRLITQIGNANLFFPYRLTNAGADVRVFNKVVSFGFSDFAAGVSEFQHGTRLSFPRDAFSSLLSFFIGDIEVTNGQILGDAQIDRRDTSLDLRLEPAVAVAVAAGLIKGTEAYSDWQVRP